MDKLHIRMDSHSLLKRTFPFLQNAEDGCVAVQQLQNSVLKRFGSALSRAQLIHDDQLCPFNIGKETASDSVKPQRILFIRSLFIAAEQKVLLNGCYLFIYTW